MGLKEFLVECRRKLLGTGEIVDLLHTINTEMNGNYANNSNFVLHSFEGFTLLLDSSSMVDWCILKEGDWESESWELLRKEIQATKIDSDSVFLDIGAYFGFYSLKAHSIGFRRIHAFEADKDNYLQLGTNLLINSLSREITTHNKFLSNSSGNVRIADGLNIPQNRGMAGMILKNSEPGVSVECVPLDKVMEFMDCLVVIKIDVEGNEKSVLEGAFKVLNDNNVILLIENLGFKNLYHSFLLELGFRLVASSNKDQNEIWRNFDLK